MRLLDRSARGIEATIYGRALLRWSLAAFEDLRQGVKEIEFLADPTVGELRIGCHAAMMEGFLPVILNRLHRTHPRLTFAADGTHVRYVGLMTQPETASSQTVSKGPTRRFSKR